MSLLELALLAKPELEEDSCKRYEIVEIFIGRKLLLTSKALRFSIENNFLRCAELIIRTMIYNNDFESVNSADKVRSLTGLYVTREAKLFTNFADLL